MYLPTGLRYRRIGRQREAVDALVSVFSIRRAETEAAMSSASKGLQAAQQKGKVKVARDTFTFDAQYVPGRYILSVGLLRDPTLVRSCVGTDLTCPLSDFLSAPRVQCFAVSKNCGRNFFEIFCITVFPL